MKRNMMIYAVTVAVLSMASFAQASLVVHYTFDETANQVVADSSGNGYDATVSSGSGWLATGGQYGGALNVGGFRMTTMPTAGISNLTAVTVSLWVKGATDNKAVFFASADTVENSAQRVLSLRTDTTGGDYLANAGFTGGNYSSRDLAGANGADASVWEHWALTATAGSDMAVFRNGVLVDSRTIEADRLLSGIQFAEIGRDNNGGFKGQVDDFKLYDTAMTATEIQTIAMIPEPGTLGLVAVFGGGILFIRRRFKI